MNYPKLPLGKEEKSDQGFTRVSSRKRGGRKQYHQEISKKTSVSNNFEVLEDLAEETLEKEIKAKQGVHSIQETEETRPSPGVETKEDRTREEADPEFGDEAEDMDIGELDLKGIEQAYAVKGKWYMP